MRSALPVVAAVLVLASCTQEVTGTPADDGPPSSAVAGVDLTVPLEMRPVLESGTPATTLPDPSGEQLPLGEPLLTVAELDGAEAKMDQGSGRWVLELDLTDADAATFGDWTGEHVGERLAVVIDGEVVIAPQIQGAITGGEVQVTGDYTRDEINDLLDRITGR